MACADPIGISNGIVITSLSYTNGSRVYYTCNSGFQMVGSPSQLCDDGSWLGTAPSCTLIDNSPDVQTNQNVTFPSINISGMDVPLWLLIVFAAVLLLLVLGIFLFLILHYCCGYNRVRPSRRASTVEDPDNQGTRRQNGVFIYDDGRGQTSSPGRSGCCGRRKQRPRFVKVLPGQQVFVMQENDVTSLPNTKVYSPQAANGGVVTGYPDKDDDNGTPSNNSNSGRFKRKATQVKNQLSWMPHSNPVRSDLSHAYTTTK